MTAQCTTTVDRQCSGNTCTCPNGTPTVSGGSSDPIPIHRLSNSSVKSSNVMALLLQIERAKGPPPYPLVLESEPFGTETDDANARQMHSHLRTFLDSKNSFVHSIFFHFFLTIP